MSKEDNDSFTIDLGKNLGAISVSLSILIGSLIISGSMFYTSNKTQNNTPPEVNGAYEDNNDNNAEQPPVLPGESEEENAKQVASTSLDDDPILGDKSKAKVAIVEFTDYECPFCQRHNSQTTGQIIANFVDTGDAVLAFRDFPLSFHEPAASEKAITAECVQELAGDNKYFEFKDKLFSGSYSTKEAYADAAAEIGLSKTEVQSCVENNAESLQAEVNKDLQDGTNAGVTGTPGFVIGTLNPDGTVDGEVVAGALPYSEFERIINSYL